MSLKNPDLDPDETANTIDETLEDDPKQDIMHTSLAEEGLLPGVPTHPPTGLRK